jgi:hypothetical protein
MRMSEITNNTTKIKKITFAIPADAAATPENPKKAAIIAMTRKIITHVSIVNFLFI